LSYARRLVPHLRRSNHPAGWPQAEQPLPDDALKVVMRGEDKEDKVAA
jgi:hypothetical protein